MRHSAVFSGQHTLVIDEKNRLLIPSDIRKRIDEQVDGSEFWIVIGTNDHIWIYTDVRYRRMVDRLEDEIVPHEDAHDFDLAFFSEATQTGLDKQGRLLVPSDLLEETSTGREVTLVGVRDHMEVWNRDEWQQKRRELRQRSNDIRRRVRDRVGRDST